MARKCNQWLQSPTPKAVLDGKSHFSKHKPEGTNHGPKTKNFSPIVQKNQQKFVSPRSDILGNSVNSEQIHIIGSKCYTLTPAGLKMLGVYPDCQPTPGVPPVAQLSTKYNMERAASKGSIWDSFGSLPLVKRLAKTLGYEKTWNGETTV